MDVSKQFFSVLRMHLWRLTGTYSDTFDLTISTVFRDQSGDRTGWCQWKWVPIIISGDGPSDWSVGSDDTEFSRADSNNPEKESHKSNKKNFKIDYPPRMLVFDRRCALEMRYFKIMITTGFIFVLDLRASYGKPVPKCTISMRNFRIRL